MQLIALTREQVDLAAYRFESHENSAAALSRHFRRIAEPDKLRAARAIRRIERRFAINLGTICFKVLETETQKTSEIQRQVMEYVAYWRELEDGDFDLVVVVDRVREIDRLAQGEAEWQPLRDS